MKKIVFLSTFILSTLSANFSNIETFSCKFVQKIVSNKNKIEYSGEMFAKKPSFVKWVYESPIIKTVCIDKKEILIIEYDLEQAIIAKLDEAIDFLSILKSAKKIDNNSYKAIYDGVSYDILTTKNNKIETIKYIDKNENQVEISIIEPKINEKLENEQLKCQIPANFDILSR